MTTLFILIIITIAVAYCNYKHSKLMKLHNDALNSYYQNKMINDANRYKSFAVVLTIIALVVIFVHLFGLIEKRSLRNISKTSTYTHYDS